MSWSAQKFPQWSGSSPESSCLAASSQRIYKPTTFGVTERFALKLFLLSASVKENKEEGLALLRQTEGRQS